MQIPVQDPQALFNQAVALRAQGRLEEALPIFDRLTSQFPAVAGARSIRGLTLCNLERFDEGLADLRLAIDLEPRNPDFHCNYGMVLYVLERIDEAGVALDRALALSPRHADALNNMSLVLGARGDFEGAERMARKALEVRPDFAQAHVNLGQALLALGKFAEAWQHQAFNPDPRMTLRDPRMAPILAHVRQLPPAGSPLVLHGEQGLGDTLFYLRFAPRLAARGIRLAFWGDARLHPLLARTGVFEAMLGPDKVPAFPPAWVGDLPFLLGAGDPLDFPPPLPLRADAGRVNVMRARLEAVGAPPYVGLSWKAGRPRRGNVVLSKEITVEAVGAALAGINATFVSLQRNPEAGARQTLAGILGVPILDFSSVNDDLEDALALLSILDSYVGVSNTNTHLRAGLGLRSDVLVPFPPEWRWLAQGERSPWFRDALVHRQASDGDWTVPLSGLRASLP